MYRAVVLSSILFTVLLASAERVSLESKDDIDAITHYQDTDQLPYQVMQDGPGTSQDPQSPPDTDDDNNSNSTNGTSTPGPNFDPSSNTPAPGDGNSGTGDNPTQTPEVRPSASPKVSPGNSTPQPQGGDPYSQTGGQGDTGKPDDQDDSNSSSTGLFGLSSFSLVVVAIAIVASALFLITFIRRRRTTSGFQNMPPSPAEANTYRPDSSV